MKIQELHSTKAVLMMGMKCLTLIVALASLAIMMIVALAVLVCSCLLRRLVYLMVFFIISLCSVVLPTFCWRERHH